MRALHARKWQILALAAAILIALALLDGAPTAAPVSAASLVVTTTADSGPGSLREAITTANASPGLDTITFAIPGDGVQTVQPLSALPTITDPVLIDGTRQPGYQEAPLIELSGASAGADVDGLTITAGGSTIRALTINRFGGHGVVIRDSGDNVVEGSFIGTTAHGDEAAGNGRGGLVIEDSANNRVGGETPESRNVISGNRWIGVVIQGAPGAVVQGNYIGTDIAGAASIANKVAGLMVRDGADIVIGGEHPGAGNLVSGNLTTDGTGPGTGGGVWIMGGTNIRVVGNVIGMAADGRTALPNWDGVEISTEAQVDLGGTAEGAGNVIAGNRFFGVAIGPFPGAGPGGPPPQSIAVRGNRIGVDAGGAPAPGQPVGGVLIQGENRTEVGGVSTGAGNTIASDGNRAVGIRDGRGGRVLGNSIYGNGMADIDLGTGPLAGPTPNDPGDLDDGPNDLQNYPVIAAVQVRDATTTVAGSLDSRPGITYRVEVFAGMVNPRTGRAEARRFLGAADVTTDAGGSGTFTLSVGPLEADEWVSATATGPASGTSELSPPVAPTR